MFKSIIITCQKIKTICSELYAQNSLQAVQPLDATYEVQKKRCNIIGGVTAVMIVIVVIIIVANIYCAYVGFPTINHFNPHKFIMK